MEDKLLTCEETPKPIVGYYKPQVGHVGTTLGHVSWWDSDDPPTPSQMSNTPSWGNVLKCYMYHENLNSSAYFLKQISFGA